MPKASRLASCRAGPPTGLILPQSLHCATSYLGLTRLEPSSKLGAQNPCLTGLNESGLGVAFNILGVPLPALSSPPVIGYLQPFQPSQNDRCPLAAEPQRPSQGPRGRAGSRGWARSWLSLGCPGAGGQDVRPGSRHSWSKVAGSGRFIISGNPSPWEVNSPCQGHAPLACQPFLPFPLLGLSDWVLGRARGTSSQSQRLRLGSQASISPPQRPSLMPPSQSHRCGPDPSLGEGWEEGGIVESEGPCIKSQDTWVLSLPLPSTCRETSSSLP